MPDDDGYPSEEELARIKAWPATDLPGCFAFLRTCWWMPDWGWHECETLDRVFKRAVRRYDVSTGGWSGNESLIAALAANWMAWTLTWQEHRRGGHYVFLVPLDAASQRTSLPTEG